MKSLLLATISFVGVMATIGGVLAETNTSASAKHDRPQCEIRVGAVSNHDITRPAHVIFSMFGYESYADAKYNVHLAVSGVNLPSPSKNWTVELMSDSPANHRIKDKTGFWVSATADNVDANTYPAASMTFTWITTRGTKDECGGTLPDTQNQK